MESDIEDVKRMTQFINNQKSNYQGNFQLEFQDFINFKQDLSDDDEINDSFLHEEEDITGDDENDIKALIASELPIQVSATTLTEDERKVIDSCTDPELKKLLILNRLKNMQLIKLHKKIKDLVIQCEESLQEKNTLMKSWEMKHANQQTYIWKLAAPYFKDKKFYPCPLNKEALNKRSNNELTVYDLAPSPKWSTIEIDRLINAVKCNYNINRQNDIVKKIIALRTEENDETDHKSNIKEIMDLEEELQIVKKDEKIPPINSNDFINWRKVSETFLKDKHSPIECQSVWHMLVHPSINKSEWSEEENKNLEVIAKRHSYQNWEEISAELNTDRTAFTTCLHYFSKLCDKYKKSKFTPEEDKLLVEVVETYRTNNTIPWNKVVCHFQNRSRHQLYCRYTYFLSQNHVKKGKFSEAEDVLLMILVNKFGRNFRKCAEYMPHRSQVQLKSRYSSNLQRQIKKGTFTVDDDKIILDYVKKHGEKSWSGLSEKLNRCNGQIRQRYKLIKSFMAANPDAPLSEIPKRKRIFDKPSDQYSFLSFIADQYKDTDYIPTLSMIEESLQLDIKTQNLAKAASQNKKTNQDLDKSKMNVKNIDTMLIDFFVSELKAKQNNASEMNIVEASNNVEEVLSVLGAKLDIPKIFEYNIHLDNIDVEILERLSQKKIDNDNTHVSTLVTPNIGTLVGLRSLIIKHKDYKQSKGKSVPGGGTKDNKIVWSMEKNLLKLTDKARKEVVFHRELFAKRFDSLFHWCAVLSLEKPNLCVRFDRPTSSSRLLTRTYVRKSVDHNSEQPVVKKRKIDISTLADLKQQSSINGSQIHLVDKNFVDRLMRNKNNVIVATVTNSDGVAKPVLLTKNSTLTSKSPIIKNTNSRDNEENDDFEDLQKLNVVLKSQAIDETPSCSNEEYQAIKGDVQLLKEILRYEKIKVEPDIDD